MNFEKIKKYGFLIFSLLVFLLVIVGVLGVWDVIGYDKAWKSAYTLFFMSFGVLIVLGVAQKLFDKGNK